MRIGEAINGWSTLETRAAGTGKKTRGQNTGIPVLPFSVSQNR